MKVYLLIFGIGGLFAYLISRAKQVPATEGTLVPTTGIDLWGKLTYFPTQSSTYGANQTTTARAIQNGGWTGLPPEGHITELPPPPNTKPGAWVPKGSAPTGGAREITSGPSGSKWGFTVGTDTVGVKVGSNSVSVSDCGPNQRDASGRCKAPGELSPFGSNRDRFGGE